MLYSIPDMRRLTTVPYEDTYAVLRRALDLFDRSAFDRICKELSNNFDAKEIDTSSWIPGSDWDGTVYQPIWEACGRDTEAAAKFFGQIVWQVVMDRPDCWSSGHYELDGKAIRGRTYFRIICP